MLIRKLTLQNFRNFKNCSIEFSCDEEKNFTIILGQNTHGKTTLVKAFIWCLYRQNLFKDRNLLNSDVANYMLSGTTKDVKVILELEHKNFSYKIITTEKYFKSNSGNIRINLPASSTIAKSDGKNTIPFHFDGANEEIDSILRPELKEYFFFDGETNSIENVSSKTNLTSAVTNILGLNSIEMLRDYYDPTKNESVTSYLRRQLIPVADALLDDLNQNLNDQMERKDLLIKDKHFIESEIEKLKNQKEEFEAKLDANKDIALDQKDKKHLEISIENARRDKEIIFSRMIQSFNVSNSFLKVLFANSFLKFNLRNLISESSFKSENSYRGITEQAVDDIIKAGRCLCGNVISDHGEAYNNLIKAKEHMEPRDYGKYISDFISGEESNVYSGKTILENITSEASKVLEKIEQVYDEMDRLLTIKKRIEGRDDVGEIQSSLERVNDQISFQRGRLQRIIENDIPAVDKKIEELVLKIEKSSEKTDGNIFIQKCIDYATCIYDRSVDRLKRAKIEIKEKLQEEIGSIFKSMYHGNREIKIDDNFRATTMVKYIGGDKAIDGSTGLSTVVNYSFVAGLMKLAKNSILFGDDIADDENIGETYPLVMDAPFSNTDENHIKNICKALPSYCDQIIMFVMQKDFHYASTSISHKIGKKYKIVKNSETDATIIEEVI